VACPFDEEKEKIEAEHWNRLAPEFLRLGLLNHVNRETLIHICQVVRDIRIYEQKISEEGHFVDYPMFSKATGEQTGTIERENNAMRPLRDARLLHEKLLNEFGGNPSSASKVASQKKPDSVKPGNPFAFSFAGKKASNG
jgi:phage terminase small subunit